VAIRRCWRGVGQRCSTVTHATTKGCVRVGLPPLLLWCHAPWTARVATLNVGLMPPYAELGISRCAFQIGLLLLDNSSSDPIT
jgi:hypothetical protein